MAYISKEFIENLIDSTQIEDIVKDFVDLKKEGSNLKGLSPFTKEKTPSFMVSPRKQIWKDFSSGKGGNNALSFLMAKGYNYIDAIEYIAKNQSKEIVYDNSKEAKSFQEKQLRKNEVRPYLNNVVEMYHNNLKTLDKNHPAFKEIFGKRKYTDAIIKTYKIGYAPGDKFVYNNFKERGIVKQGQDISVISNNHDFFFNRVVYPIFDSIGEVVSIAGRELKNPPKVKWLNGKTTELYQKDHIWYGMHLAKQEIRSNNIAYIMEGYNDVISFQTNEILNAIAPCGTSIHDNQIKELKKYTDSVVFCMDGDIAGQKSSLKNIPRFLSCGFRCFVIKFKDCDPDDFVRMNVKEIDKNGLLAVLEVETEKTDGFRLLLDELNGKDEIAKVKIAKNLCDLLSEISDDTLIGPYKKWLQNDSGVSMTTINKWIKEFDSSRSNIKEQRFISDNEYQLPYEIEMSDQILSDIKKYQMFQANNKVYSQINSDPPYKFNNVSNFSINIIQHMRDEDFPKKLVSAKNVFNESFVFDVPSETFNSHGSFQKAMTNFGNFRWHGKNEDLLRLQAMLFDKMGNGRSLEVLGWQHEGFYLFNNLVVVPDGENIDIDQNGCFQFKEISYYVPSANIIYRNNPHKYTPQKQFRHIPGTISSLEFFGKIKRVHRSHAISSIFHAISCMFHDIVAKNLKGFPINFSYGPPGTGKDELNHAVKSLWGIPQTATNLEGKNATKTATIRELAQFNNALLEWSEYSRGDSELDGTIKSVWDLRGKKIGKIESRVATDNIPVLCGVSLTGNEYPDNAAIITRVVWNDMNRTDFNEEDEKAFNELNDIIDEGVTHITVNILKNRALVEKNFNKEYRLLMDVYQARMPDCNKRMLKNISTFTAFYNVLKDVIDFPFTQSEILDHFTKITTAQMRKLTSSSINSRWWDCFIASMRGVDHDKIKVGREIKLEGSFFYFQFSNCYSKLQRQWYTQYRDSAPAKSTMKEALEKDSSYHSYTPRVDFKKGLPRVQSSAIIVDLMKMPDDISELIKSEVSLQEFEMPPVPYRPNMETEPLKESIGNILEDKQGDIPF
ncbi:DNA primase [Psychroserpens sp. Hel_I_66]|uniref:DNA primase n=1 Tax=Psychroserpens sp. Hel_I_66 TaxID=1250004 RepID=UPI0006469381|nr:CHC2 zinc finger domain-containing protein [Psychroserpens sp. Hel_I_66]